MSFTDALDTNRDVTTRKDGGVTDWLSSSTVSRLEQVNDTDWGRSIKIARRNRLRAHDWYIECAIHGNELLKAALEINKSKRGGIPVLRGTRFTASQALAEIAESDSISEVASDFDLDEAILRQLLNGLALTLDRPFPE